MRRNPWRFSKPTIAIGVFGLAVGLLAALTGLITGQPVSKLSQRPASPHFVGVPDDWTHHHVVFSNPGAYEQVAKDPAAYAKWLTIRYDTRFILQQMKQNRALQAPATAPDFATLAGRLGAPISDRWPIRRHRPPVLFGEPVKQDWSQSLGSGGTVGAGQFPAKFSFSTSGASCSDFAVFNTGLAGVSSGQANIVAYSNLYSSPTCTGTVPSVYWAYYSGTGNALTSPVISLDGSKVAYVENTSGGAILRIIAWQSGQGTAAGAATPTESYTNTTVGAGGNTAWNTTNCPAGDSCMISVAFQNAKQDSRSAPFYVYEGADTIYVGDASGYLHKFTGVFLGTPGEVTSGGWPIEVNTSGYILTSPVYDPGTSGNIFVADSGGFLYSYKASGPTHEMTSSKLTYASGTVGIVDGPLVDPTTEEVYVFVGDDANTTTSFGCDVAKGCSGVFQFAAGTTGTGSGACAATSLTAWPSGAVCGAESVFGVGTTATPTIYDGTFDHIYFVGSGTTGDLWTCSANSSSEPRLSYIPMTAFVPSGDVLGVADTAIGSLTSSTATCSPVTEIWGTGGTTDDYIFLSVSANGNISDGSTCTGDCVYNFLVATGGTSTTGGTESTPTAATAGLNATGGSSGIIIDNTSSSTGASEIYFSSLSNEACPSSSSGCAVQASQSGP